MPAVLQFRRGTTSELSTVTGSEGELFVDTIKKTITVHDGTTAGGTRLATEGHVSTALSSYVTTETFNSSLGDIDAALAAINGE